MEKHTYKDHEIVYDEVLGYYAVWLPKGGFEGFETLEEAKEFIDSQPLLVCNLILGAVGLDRPEPSVRPFINP